MTSSKEWTYEKAFDAAFGPSDRADIESERSMLKGRGGSSSVPKIKGGISGIFVSRWQLSH